MNDQQVENKVGREVAARNKDLNILEGDRAVQFGRFEANVNRAVGNFTTRVGDGVIQMGEKLEKFNDEVKSTMADVAATVKKDVGQGLSTYNTQAQVAAFRIPGGFGQMAFRYPWVALSLALAVGFLLGSLFKSGPKPVYRYQI